MSELSGIVRLLFLGFFASHIPITFLIDGQALLSPAFYPKFARDALDWYTSTFQDHLMQRPHDLWFKSMVACELLFQVPFFIVAVYALWTPGNIDGKGWFRSACIAYGAHTSTTLIPILTSIVFDDTLSYSQIATLFGFYLPYLIFPFWMLTIAVRSKDIFSISSSKIKQY